MPKREGKYNIKAASSLLGVKPGTLRAWERRYKLITPARNESGHRLYTEEQIYLLKDLIQKIGQGFTISQAISLLGQQVREHTGEPVNSLKVYTEELIKAFLDFDAVRAHRAIDVIYSLFTEETILSDVLMPVATEMSVMKDSGKMAKAHVLFGAALLRSRLEPAGRGTIGSFYLPKVMALCAPGDSNELGLLLLTYYLRKKGFDVIYLGAGLNEEDISLAVDQARPAFLVFSCTKKEQAEAFLLLARDLASRFPELILGAAGSAVQDLEGKESEEFREYFLGSTIIEWDEWMNAFNDSKRQFTNPLR